MKITIGSDHRGFRLKQSLITHFTDVDWLDVGTDNQKRTDYPVFAQLLCDHILKKHANLGILICGSGVGMAIAANRYKKIYAALCFEPEIARIAREDDGINVLVLPSDFVDEIDAIPIVKAWFEAEFKGEHYQERLDMVDLIG